jgi:hypothetical protein
MQSLEPLLSHLVTLGQPIFIIDGHIPPVMKPFNEAPAQFKLVPFICKVNGYEDLKELLYQWVPYNHVKINKIRWPVRHDVVISVTEKTLKATPETNEFRRYCADTCRNIGYTFLDLSDY